MPEHRGIAWTIGFVAAFALLPVWYGFGGPGNAGQAKAGHNTNWPTYNGSPDNLHYSSLKQINVGNVARLKPVWSYDTHEKGGLEAQPLIADGVLYGYSPHQEVFALERGNGQAVVELQFRSGSYQAGARSCLLDRRQR